MHGDDYVAIGPSGELDWMSRGVGTVYDCNVQVVATGTSRASTILFATHLPATN